MSEELTLEIAEGYRVLGETLAGSDLKEFIHRSIEGARENLEVATDINDVLRLQGMILSFRYILGRFAAAEEIIEVGV